MSDDPELNEILKRKTGVFIAIPTMGGEVKTPLLFWIMQLYTRTIDADCPYFFKVFMPDNQTPVELARNQCVEAFLKEPFYKKLWFVDSDMNPPFNALDLLEYDEPLVSGMTYIWASDRFDKDGFYQVPTMKINAFDRREEQDDFMSKLPTPDGKVFRCDATGAACLVIRRDVLEEMPEPWFRTLRDPYGKTLRGEDMDFTWRCTQKGYRPLYVPRVQFGHIKEVDLKQVTVYGMASMRAAIDRAVAMPDPAKGIASLPRIQFPGEKPKNQDAPSNLRVLEGGAKV